MPEVAIEKIRPHPAKSTESLGSVVIDPTAPAYAELQVASNFSFLRGASHPDELVAQAAAMGCSGIAITDINTLAGVVRAHVAAKEVGIGFAVGAWIVLGGTQRGRDVDPAIAEVESEGVDIKAVSFATSMLLYPTDRVSYGRLCRLLTRGKRRTAKGHCLLTMADIAEFQEGLLCIAVPPASLEEGDEAGEFVNHLESLRRIFDNDRLSLATSCLYGPHDHQRLDLLAQVGHDARVPLVATNDVHYHVPGRRALQDVLTCIRHTTTIDRSSHLLFPHGERFIKGPHEMARLMARYPHAIERTMEIFERTRGFSLDQLRYEYPEEVCPPGKSAMEYLRDLTWEGALWRYGYLLEASGYPRDVEVLKAIPSGDKNSATDTLPDVVRRIENEFRLIEELGYAKYFLTVHDIVKQARAMGILCQGRGAAANSIVCYCLDVTSVNPSQMDLLFERFISKERNEPPDIDIDFEHERREEILQYIYQKYGRDRAALTCEVITYRGRSAVRDVGKAMGLSLDCVDRLAKQIDWWHKGPIHEEQMRSQGLDPNDPIVRQVAELTRELQGFPRHLSQHVGGFVMTQGLLEETVPIENAAMPDRTMIEWDKDDIDAMGMLKVDCLGLGMLSVIKRAFSFLEHGQSREIREVLARPNGASLAVHPEWARVNAHALSQRASEPSVRREVENLDEARLGMHCLSLASIPQDDPHVYEMVQHADTVGVFQIESRAQMSMLPRLRPENFYDLVIEVAIVRPGPIQGKMVHPYLKRRMKLEEATFPSPEVETVLKKTLGVPLFQEQAMKLAIVAAGFTPGEADGLRRAIAAWKKRPGQLERFGERLISGMLKNGYTREFAERCYEQIQGFSGYGFPESHAASFALLVIASAWLKRHHPAAFAAALINSQPMGFYAPAQLVRDAKEHGVEVRPVDVNYSRWDCTLEPKPGANGCLGDDDLNASEERLTSWARSEAAKAAKTKDRESLEPFVPTPSATWGHQGPSLRLGLRMVAGLNEKHARLISDAVYRHGPFKTIHSLWLATDVPVATLRRLASADAFGSMGLSRRQALWEVRNLRDEHLPLFDQVMGREPIERESSAGDSIDALSDPSPDRVQLPEMAPERAVLQDYAAIGLSLKAHPITFLREALTDARVLVNAALKDPKQTPQGKRVTVAGIVLVRQRPGTASGIVFMTIEDETGIANLIIRPQIFERFRKAARHSVCVMATGTVERQGEVVHVQVQRILELSQALKRDIGLSSMSRDFH